jgi:hypothetical protein
MMHMVMGWCMGVDKDEPVWAITAKIMNDMSILFVSEINEIKSKNENNGKTI